MAACEFVLLQRKIKHICTYSVTSSNIDKDKKKKKKKRKMFSHLTICLSPAGISQVKLFCVAGGSNWICKGSWFLQCVFDLHRLFACD